MTERLELGITLFPFDRWPDVDSMLRVVQRADELGFASVSFPEHLLVPADDPLNQLNRTWYDTAILAARLAAATHSIRYLLNARVLPYRSPIDQAKTLATLDVVSGGRLTVVAATGWVESEFRALGIPFSERGARTDEALAVMKSLWTSAPATFAGRWTSYESVDFSPRCLQQPHVPLWIGGSGPGALRRAGQFGDGWAPMLGSLDDVERGFTTVQAHAEAAGRDPHALALCFPVTVGVADDAVVGAVELERAEASDALATQRETQQTIDLLGRCADAGVTHVAGAFAWSTPSEFIDHLEWLAADVLPALSTVARTGAVP